MYNHILLYDIENYSFKLRLVITYIVTQHKYSQPILYPGLSLPATPFAPWVKRTLQMSTIGAEGILQEHRNLPKHSSVGVMTPHRVELLQLGPVLHIRHVLNRMHHIRQCVLTALGALADQTKSRRTDVGVLKRDPRHVVV